VEIKCQTRCNRGFYCRSYCLLNMFRAPLCPSSGGQDLYRCLLPVVLDVLVYRSMVWCGAEGYVSGLQDAAVKLAKHVSGNTTPIIRSSKVLYSGCCLWHFVLWFSSCWSGVELRVMCPVCRMLQHPANRTHNPQLHTRPAT